MARRSPAMPSLAAPRALAATVLVAAGAAGCSSTGSSDPGNTSIVSSPVDSGSATASAPPRSAPPSTHAPQPTETDSSPFYPAGVFTYPPSPSGGSGFQVTSPCGSGILTMAARPDGKGVAMVATLRNPARTTGWVGGIGVSPFAKDEGEPILPRQRVSDGVLTISGSNLTGSDALHDPTLNYAWPQSVSVELVQTGRGGDLCGSTAYLNATRGTLDVDPFHVKIRRDTGTITVQESPLDSRGPWHLTITTTSPDGAQHQTRSVVAHTGNYIGAVYGLHTTFTGVSNLDDFTTLTIRASKTDGSHTEWVTLTRTP